MYIVSFLEIADGIDDFSVSKEEELRINASRAPFPASENAGTQTFANIAAQFDVVVSHCFED